MNSKQEECWIILRRLILIQKSYLTDVQPEMNLYQDLSFKSISLMKLFLEIEAAFGIRLRGDDVSRQRLQTAEDLVNLILRRQQSL